MNHQSQMKYCWLKRVPLGQRKLYLGEALTVLTYLAQTLLEFPLGRVIGTDVESLTVRFWIGIVTLDLEEARERELGKGEITFASHVSVVSGGKAKIG